MNRDLFFICSQARLYSFIRNKQQQSCDLACLTTLYRRNADGYREVGFGPVTFRVFRYLRVSAHPEEMGAQYRAGPILNPANMRGRRNALLAEYWK